MDRIVLVIMKIISALTGNGNESFLRVMACVLAFIVVIASISWIVGQVRPKP